MDGYGIQIHSNRTGTARYRTGDTERWELAEAEALAYDLLQTRGPAFVAVGDGEHEFRMWHDEVSNFGNFTNDGLRWSAWYVDVEINGHRWRYMPVRDLDDYPEADDTAEAAASLHPDVTRIWVGRSDGSEEQESEVAGH